MLGSTFQTTIKNLLVSLQYAFQNLIEATMLLLAALGPLAVGGSLLPVAAKAIFAWITGFLSMGIAKISFNLIVVLNANVIMGAPAQYGSLDPALMWFLMFVGILAPILSLALAGAGEFAVFSAISNTSSWVKEKI